MPGEMKQPFFKALAMFSILLTLVSCAEYSEPKSEESLLLESAEPFDDDSTTQVSGLSQLPNLREFLSGETDTGFGLANGTPPVFISIDEQDEVEQHLTGSLDSLMSSLRSSSRNQRWSEVENYLQTLREAQTKCRIMEFSATMLDSLSTRIYSMCQVQWADYEGLLQYKSGTQFPSVFSMPTGRRTKYVEIELLGEDPQEEFEAGLAKFVIAIPPWKRWSSKYTLELTTCTRETESDKWENSGTDVITVDNRAGVLGVGSHHKQAQIVESNENPSEAAGEISLAYKSELYAPLFSSNNGRYRYNYQLRRHVKVEETTGQELYSGDYDRTQWRGRLSILGNEMTTKYYDRHEFKDQDQSYEAKVRGLAHVEFSGLSTSAARFYEGAGRFKFKYKGNVDIDDLEGHESVAFNFDETQTPTYETVDVPRFTQTLRTHSFRRDDILRDKRVKISLNLPNKICRKTQPDAVYSLDRSTNEFAVIAAGCSTPFTTTPLKCSELEQMEAELWDSLRQCGNQCRQNRQDADDDDDETDESDDDDSDADGDDSDDSDDSD